MAGKKVIGRCGKKLFRLCLCVKETRKKEGVRQKEQLNHVPLSWQQLVSWLL